MQLPAPTLWRMIAIFSLLLVGCDGGDDDRPRALAPVSGKVTVKGKTPIGATIVFVPQATTHGPGATGFVDANGEYKLEQSPRRSGIEPGVYTVTITKMMMKNGSRIPDGKTAAEVGAVQIIPPPLGDPTSTDPLKTVTVPKEGGRFDFKIP